MMEFNWAQDKINQLTGTEQEERLKHQNEEASKVISNLNREQRIALEKADKRLQKQIR
jgi:hypothetical protein